MCKGWETESRDNLVASWCTGGRTWRKVEDNRVGNKKLLVAWSDKGYEKIYEWMWYVSKDEKLDRGISGKVKIEWDTKEAMNIFDSRLYHKVAVSSRKGYNLSSV